MLVVVFGVVLVRVRVHRALVVRVRMLVSGGLIVLVLMVVIGVSVLVRVLYAVRMLVRVLVLVRHGSRFGPQAAGALPGGMREGRPEWPSFASAIYGASTLSMTWITPLDWYTS